MITLPATMKRAPSLRQRKASSGVQMRPSATNGMPARPSAPISAKSGPVWPRCVVGVSCHRGAHDICAGSHCEFGFLGRADIGHGQTSMALDGLDQGRNLDRARSAVASKAMMCAPAPATRLHILDGRRDVDFGVCALGLDETDHGNGDPGAHGGDVRDTLNADRAGAALDDRGRQSAMCSGASRGDPGVRLTGNDKRSVQ